MSTAARPGDTVSISNPPTYAVPIEGVWRQVSLPVRPDSGPGRFELLVEDPNTGWYFEPTDPVPSVPVDLPGVPIPAQDLRPLFEGVRRDAFAKLQWPPIAIQIAPRGLGLAGLPSHFWITGYGGESFSATEETVVPADVGADIPTDPDPRRPGSPWYPADGPRRRDRRLAVTAFAWPVRYAWDWGDGATGQSGRSLGRAPQGAGSPDSDVRHQYEFASRAFPRGFPVSLGATFGAAYEVLFDGQRERVELGTTTISFRRDYPVQELQAVLLAPDSRPPGTRR